MTLAMKNSLALHTDFQFLSGVIPDNPKLMPCNLDMVIERNGYFFVGEWKQTNEKISQGQKITLQALASNPKFYVYIIDGVSNHKRLEVRTICRLNNQKLRVLGEGVDCLKKAIRAWYKHVDAL